MPSHREFESAISDGLTFLRAKQLPDGSFASYTSLLADDGAKGQLRRTTFVPALMLGALSGLRQPAATSICDGLSKFVWDQRGDGGSFNYWAATEPERAHTPYPDDLDDTFCALVGTYLYRPARIDEAVLADTVKLLLAAESSVGGPYRTWLVAPDSDTIWLDVDLAVNSVIAYFLSLVADRLPALDRLLSDAIRHGRLSSPYYPDEYPLLYYLSRICPPADRTLLLAKIRAALENETLSPLATSLCLNASLNLGEPRPDAAASLIETQRADGSWPGGGYCMDPVRGGQVHVHGAAALTTAFALEALQRSTEPPSRRKVDRKPSTDEALRGRLGLLARRQLGQVPPDLGRTASTAIDRLIRSSTGQEIIELPLRVSESLTSVHAEPPPGLLHRLSLANLYGWLAYSIYDDVIDGEGKNILVPVANLALRRSLDGFSEALALNRPFRGFVRRVFDTIDGANAWELAHCRFIRRGRHLIIGPLPDYGDLSPLANRSLGHSLPPLAVLVSAGGTVGDADFSCLLEAMGRYLIARQLNDDAHDWPADLSRGRISYVVGRLLAAGPASEEGKYALNDLVAAAYERFWQAELPLICEEIRRQTRLGRRALGEVTAFKRHNHIARLFDGIDESVETTLAKHRQAQTFLKHYEKSSVKV